MNLESQNIRVGVRIRPLSSREILERRKTVIHADEASSSIVSSQSQLQEARSFSFDHAFGPQSNSDDISTCVKRALDSCFEGYNASLLAYGQTGSGKTFTVQQMTASLASFLFQGVKDRIEQGKIDCIASASYIELYNEELRDLLIPAPPSQAAEFVLSSSQQAPFTSSSITIREHPNGEIFLEGASEIVVESEEQLLLLIGVGDAARSTAATALNERSSRSHSVLIINLTQQLPPDPETGELVIITGKLSIVDLAGSERTKKSKSEGSRMKEAVNINGGLSALGNVISALSENKKGAYIPYRDSKLTRLLQDSIGGNSLTTLIACVSPAEDSLDESLNTLKYAARAKNIKNQQRQNAISSGLTDEQRAFALLKQIVENVPVSQGLSMTLKELLEAARWSHEACVSVVQRLKQVLKCEQNVATDKSVNPSTEIHSSEVVRLTQEVARLRADKDGLESRSRSIKHAVGNGLSVMSQLVADSQMSLESQEAVLTAIGNVSASASHYLLSTQSSPGISRTRLSSYPLDFSSGSKTKIEDGTLTDTKVMEAPPTDSEVQKISDEAAALRVRVAELEAELTSCTAELRQAKEDLDKDELIFASKMAEMAEMQKLIEARQEESASPSNPHPENEAEMDNQSWAKTHRHRYTDGSRSVGIPLDGEADDPVLFGEETEDGDDAGGEGNAAAEAAGRLVGALEEEVSAGRNRAVLEQEVSREREAHEAEKAAMMDRAAKMEAEIKEREALIERLQDSESRARATSDLYKHQLQEAQQELDLKVAEVEELQTELHSLLSDKVRTTEEKTLISQCEERIAEANARLSALRKKLKEQEALIRASVETEGFGPAASRVERLRAELAKMKSQQDSLKKELMAKAAVGEKQAQARARELSALKKAAEDARKLAKKLEEETRAQREVIRRKEAQLEIDQRKIKELMSSSPASKSVSSTPKAPPSTFGSVKKDQGVLPKGLPPKPPSAWGASHSAAAAAAKTSAFNNSARARAMSYASSTGKQTSWGVSQTSGGLSRARLHPLPFPSSLPRPSHGLGPFVLGPLGPSHGLGPFGTSSATLIESLLQSARDRKRAEIEMEEANQSLEALITQSLRVDQERSKLSQQMKGNGYDEKEVQLLDRLESLARQLKDKVDEFESIAELKREVREKAASIETDIRRRLQERPLSRHEATEALMRVVDVIGTTGVARHGISFSSSTPTHSQPPPPPPPVNNAAAAPIPPVIQPLGKLALISHSLNLNSSVDVGSSTDLPLPFPTKPTPQTPRTVSISKVLDFGVALPSVDLAMNAADEALSRADQTSRSRRGSLSLA